MSDRSAPDATTPLDGDEFLEANRATREKYRAEAERVAAKEEAKRRRRSAAATDVAEDAEADDFVVDVDADRVPRALGADEVRGRSRSSRPVIIGLSAAVAVLAVATAVLGFLYIGARDDSGTASPTGPVGAEVMELAKRYAAVVGTYDAADYDDLDRRVNEIGTEKFIKEYIASSQEARKGNSAAGGVSTAVAAEAGLQSLTEDRAVVLVTLDQTVTAPQVADQVPEGIPYGSRLKATLARGDDGRWLLDDLQPI